ncbi:YidB family protein [Pseudochrobactrum kiredjianiae]|uniref:YidB family protein n=1 Tax=Pseudochrobactrum kiredjianiae TaxID=386305 RepID=A0ABW3V889_9HYPH|nr:YidB family protein [Pseudochrobactrum kiredjianiae]MDM7850368.1 YidB family protein [Pseudochrobactrum kiredjianiae]
MGLFGGDSSNNEPVPGGSLTKPVLIALGALLVGRMFSGKSDEKEQAQVPDQASTGGGLGDLLGGLLGGGQAANHQQDNAQAGGLGGLGGVLGGLLGGVLSGSSAGQAAPNAGSGGLGGGLGGLLEQLTQAGHADKVESWVGGGNNAPIEPDQLGNAIGKNTISDIARQTGVNEQDLLAELSAALPGIVDKLTANGQVPDMQQLLKMLGQK